jgi:hypothetical protein
MGFGKRRTTLAQIDAAVLVIAANLRMTLAPDREDSIRRIAAKARDGVLNALGQDLGRRWLDLQLLTICELLEIGDKMTKGSRGHRPV